MASACVYIECNVTKMILGVSRKDDPNAWGLPGGKLGEHKCHCDNEFGCQNCNGTRIIVESELAGAWRELFEETGIYLEVGCLKAIFRRDGGVTYGLPDGFWGKHVRIFQARDKSETGRVAWVTPEQLLQGPFADYNRALLTKIGRIKEHCPVRLAGTRMTYHAPCDTGDFSLDEKRCFNGNHPRTGNVCDIDGGTS